MRIFFRTAICLLFAAAVLSVSKVRAGEPGDMGHYKHFKTAVYITVQSTRALADRGTLEREFTRVWDQVKFDKVYLEVYRDGQFADDDTLDGIQQFFKDRGIQVWGGITLAKGGHGGQFGTFDYENPADRAECVKAVEMAARHFNHVILDDFFFYTSKSDADIKAKGKRSWTQYRLDTMREVARDLVLKPARRINPKIKMIIKYPNWYEHFQGLGYDLEKEAQMFDDIYTGTETRDPYITDQLLQQYESYEIFRYLGNIRPDGGDLGGWVDTYSTHYVDRYPEQLWDTLFAKAPEITLFNWHAMADTAAVKPGDRDAWKDLDTSFNWDRMVKGFKPSAGDKAPPGWGRVAGYALEKIDPVLGKLGKPIGIASYKPYQSSSGEDFLQDYLGNIGIPIELYPRYPKDADIILLTESAKFDPQIVREIKASLRAGKKVFITSGLLGALQDRGIRDIVEAAPTGRIVSIHDFINGFGAGNGTYLNDPANDNPSILFPEIHFFTNDAWAVIRGVATAKGFPILLMDRYSKGILYILTVPENISDLYNLPQPVVTDIKGYLQSGFPVRIDSPAQVALFAYDNGTFVVESYRPQPCDVTVTLPGKGGRLEDALTGAALAAQPQPTPDPDNWWAQQNPPAPKTDFKVRIEPHSFRVFSIK